MDIESIEFESEREAEIMKTVILMALAGDPERFSLEERRTMAQWVLEL